LASTKNFVGTLPRHKQTHPDAGICAGFDRFQQRVKFRVESHGPSAINDPAVHLAILKKSPKQDESMSHNKVATDQKIIPVFRSQLS